MKIILLVGCCASGKDTILNEMLKSNECEPIISFTSRPMREGEEEGKQYFFRNADCMLEKYKNGDFIEFKKYKVEGNDTWYYGIAKETFNEKSNKVYISIVDIEGMREIKKYMKSIGQKDNIITAFINTDEEIRLQRYRKRENNSNIENELIRRNKSDMINVYPFRNECDIMLWNNTKEQLKTNLKILKLIIPRFKLR